MTHECPICGGEWECSHPACYFAVAAMCGYCQDVEERAELEKEETT